MTSLKQTARIMQAADRDARKQAAWDSFVTEYTGCVDHDPGDARKRYFATMEQIARERRSCA